MGLSELVQLTLVFAMFAAGLGIVSYASANLVRTLTLGLIETSGVITDLEFHEFEDGGGGGGGGSHSYTVTLVFRYAVGEAHYTGRHLAFDVPGRLGPQERERIANYYARGEHLKVYYHPDNPQRVQLDRAVTDALFFGFLLIPTGGFLLWLSAQWGARLINSQT